MKKRLIGIIITLMMAAVLLAGCSGSGDSAGYVQGILDVAYNKGTEGYVKAADVKEEDAKKYTEQSLEAEAKVMAAYFGMEDPSDEVINTFREFCKKMYEKISYDVEAKGDKVQITVNQLTIGASEELQQYVDDFNIKQFVDGNDSAASDENFAKGVTEILSKELEKAETKKATVEVTVTEKDGKYSISDDDLKKIDEQIILYE